MNINEIIDQTKGDWTAAIAIIKQTNPVATDPTGLQAIYDGEHEILKRTDKEQKDEQGRIIGTIETAKIVLNYQYKIVESAIAFLFGLPVTFNKTTEGGDDAYQALILALKKARFHSQNRELARKLFIQKRAAKLYYVSNPDDKVNRKLASMVLSAENGEFYPSWNEQGDMDAFFRLYTIDKLVDAQKKKTDVFELYTAERIIFGEKEGSGWLITQDIKNEFGKIPVVYYEQDAEEWARGITLIDRQELSFSQLIDTNEYFSAPLIKLYGTVSGMPNKSEQGKAILCEYVADKNGDLQKSDADYLTWDQRPESLKLQFDMSEKFIFSFTQTPDLSLTNLSENKLGNNSGVALKTQLLDPILKSYNKQELFDENIQRELSVAKSILSVLNVGSQFDYQTMDIAITFNSVLPDNLAETVDYLLSATGGKAILSQETAVELNPLVRNSQTEIERVQSEQQTEAGTLNI